MNYACYIVALLLAAGNLLGYIAAPWWLVITIFVSPAVISLLIVAGVYYVLGKAFS